MLSPPVYTSVLCVCVCVCLNVETQMGVVQLIHDQVLQGCFGSGQIPVARFCYVEQACVMCEMKVCATGAEQHNKGVVTREGGISSGQTNV